MWSALLLTFALSADGLLVGFSYGARGIAIPGKSLSVIGLCTGLGMGISMLIGHLAGHWFMPGTAHIIGGGALIILGFYQLWQGLNRVRASHPVPSKRSTLLLRWHLKSLGIVIEILSAPEAADVDASGDIDPREAVALGVVLCLDTLAAGFAASFAGFGYTMVALVILGLLLCIRIGLQVGRAGGQKLTTPVAVVLPALLLIAIGVWELVTLAGSAL